MTNSYLFLPLALGVTVVTQATLNRSMSLDWGLAAAVALNAAVFFILSLGFFLVAKYTPSVVPEFWRFQGLNQNFSWLYLIPGICGFFLVMGLPWSIQNLGASTSFLLLISSQIVTSFLIEFFKENSSFNYSKLAGALFVIIGAFLSARN